MGPMLLLRLVGLVFALIQVTLALRLLLPFVEVPAAFEAYVPQLVSVSDGLIAPFRAIIEPYDLEGILAEIGPLTEAALGPWADSLDPAVIVAMVGWGIVSTFVLFVMRLVIRPGR